VRLWMLIRHLVAIAVLPFTVLVLAPAWIVRQNTTDLRIADSAGGLLMQIAGVVCLGIGLALFVSSLRRFAGEGEGTLAPWDPPKRLVVRGPYRYVRNPMISGVIFIALAEALVLMSWPLLEWAGFVLVINAIYIPLMEEPMLRDRFGAAYEQYCRDVPRLIPRISRRKRSRAA
jgi:protein-S-isoprenylcysteine O-methyltransferase Ste14